MKILFALFLFLLPASAYAQTYATWDSGKCHSDFTLSGGNLVATKSNNAWRSCLSTIGKSSGKWYLGEFTATTMTNVDGFMLGVGLSTATLTSYLGQTAFAFENNGNPGEGTKWNSNTSAAYGTDYVQGDVMMIALDMDNGQWWVGKNCTWEASGNPATGANPTHTGLSGTYYAGISLFRGPDVWTANFGASAFTCTPPAGFCQGLSDTCVGVGGTTLTSIVGLVRAFWLGL